MAEKLCELKKKGGGGGSPTSMILSSLNRAVGSYTQAIESGKTYIIAYYTSASGRSISINGGATVLDTEPSSPVAGLNFILFTATGTSLGYSVVGGNLESPTLIELF